MTRQDFIDELQRIVQVYTADRDELNDDAQLRINPLTMGVTVVTAAEMQNEIAYTNEDIDAEAAAEGDETESSDDYEEAQDPDFIPLRTLKSAKAIETLADKYF